MTFCRRNVLAFFVTVASASAADAVVHRELPYALPKNERQSLDVFAPAGSKGRPVVVWIHGGGWQRGDKSGVKLKPQAFVDRGYVFVPINYRFIPVVKMQDMASDVAHAIAWVHGHIAEYGGDPKTLFVMGHSAGAQLAALVCTDGSYLKAAGVGLNIIKGCVPVDGDTFYPGLQIDLAEARPGARLPSSYRIKFPEGNDRELSSVVHVGKDKGIPPFLIVHIADNPESGTVLQAQVLAKALTDFKIPVKVLGVPGKTHVTLDSDLGVPHDLATQAMIEFVAQYAR
jgi:acetyl esterase/lipase